MTIPERFVTGIIFFVRSLIGILLRPYEAMRNIAARNNPWEIAPIAILMGLYFALASLIKISQFRPFVLTRQFIALSSSAVCGWLIISAGLWYVSRMLGGKGTFGSLFVSWGYTYIPTVLWFLLTSILYVIIPPPRTESLPGMIFSVVFLLISISLLFWKIILSYLAIRFSLKLNLQRILVTFAIMGPMIAVYSVFMYKTGIYKVPFI